MSNKKNIEDLFKQEFQNFEAPVDPAIWTNIQAGMAANAGAAAGGIGLVKMIVIGAVAAGLIAGGIFIATQNSEPSENKAQKDTKELVVVDEKNELVEPENKLGNDEAVQEKESEGALKSDESNNGDQSSKNGDVTSNNQKGQNDNDDASKEPHTDKEDKEKVAQNTAKQSANEDNTNKPKENNTKPLSFKLNGSDISGRAPLNASFNVEANTEDITWNVKNSSGELVNVIAGKDFDMNFDVPGSYLVQVKTEFDGQVKQEEILVEVLAELTEHTEKFGFEVDETILDLKKEAIVLDMNNPLRASLKFKLTTKQIEVFKLSVYDGNTRELVYETTNIDERNWHGIDMNGNPVKGTYYFMEAVAGNGNNELEIIRKRVDIISNR